MFAEAAQDTRFENSMIGVVSSLFILQLLISNLLCNSIYLIAVFSLD